MNKYFIFMISYVALSQISLPNEVLDYSIKPHKSSYKDFHFSVEYENRKLMHDQFKVYTIVISILSNERKNINQNGHIEIWHGGKFVFSNSLHRTTKDSLPLTLKQKFKENDALIFTFDINPCYIKDSWFVYQIIRDDGSVEMNCMVKLKDFVLLPKNLNTSQSEKQVRKK